jgi:hypothetical protein
MIGPSVLLLIFILFLSIFNISRINLEALYGTQVSNRLLSHGTGTPLSPPPLRFNLKKVLNSPA